MKKLAVVLALVMACTFCACGKETGTESASSPSVYTRSTVSSVQEVNTEDEGNEITQTADGTKVEVVPTDTTQQQSTIFNEALTSMLKPMDAIMVAARVTSIAFDPGNDVSVWTSIYYYMALYGPLAKGAAYTEDKAYLYVGPDVIREVGKVICGEQYTLPPIPEQIQRISLHDDGKYYVKMDPRPDGYPIFCSAVKNGDGTYEAIAQLITVHGKILDTQSFHLEPKSETNALLGESYAYTIGSIGVG